MQDKSKKINVLIDLIFLNPFIINKFTATQKEK